jgi:hypothetical protein
MSERRVEKLLFKIPALGWLAAGRNLIGLENMEDSRVF